MRQAEHVLYITLIDFLLQLLFLGLVISVIYAIAEREQEASLDPAKAKEAMKNMAKITNLTGISDITALTDELTRLAPLQAASKHVALARDMEKHIAKAGGIESAKKVLGEHAMKRGGGQAKPSCLEGGAKLADFHAYIDKIELATPFSSDMNELLKIFNISAERVSSLPPSEFVNVFSQITGKRPECSYNVVIHEHSYDTRPRDTIRNAGFWALGYIAAPDKR